MAYAFDILESKYGLPPLPPPTSPTISPKFEGIPESDGPSFSFEVPLFVKQTCHEYRGVVMPKLMPPRALKALKNFEVRPDDIFVVTFPKSGTTWMQHILLLTLHEGDLSKLEGDHVTRKSPFIDIIDVWNHTDPSKAPPNAEVAREMPSPRILKSHCRLSWLPEDIRKDEPKAKVIYVARNPKDIAASFFHFCRLVDALPSYSSWDVFFEEFISGRAPQGSWFENVLPWWERRNHPNVLFLKYEDMKKDLRGTVERVARFIGKSLSDDVINRIAEASTFGAMKKSKSANPDFILAKVGVAQKEQENKSSSSFMRKGSVGDWKNYFTVAQNRRFDELYARKMTGSGLKFQFG
ncbi:sulfotransferase 1C2-like [Diadema antillarum]|uniref:sulfotransferase 1C2-like n=1 Tax=Diadema antillarum TaxID=105358 RepID=UPI003A86327E